MIERFKSVKQFKCPGTPWVLIGESEIIDGCRSGLDEQACLSIFKQVDDSISRGNGKSSAVANASAHSRRSSLMVVVVTCPKYSSRSTEGGKKSTRNRLAVFSGGGRGWKIGDVVKQTNESETVSLPWLAAFYHWGMNVRSDWCASSLLLCLTISRFAKYVKKLLPFQKTALVQTIYTDNWLCMSVISLFCMSGLKFEFVKLFTFFFSLNLRSWIWTVALYAWRQNWIL